MEKQHVNNFIEEDIDPPENGKIVSSEDEDNLKDGKQNSIEESMEDDSAGDGDGDELQFSQSNTKSKVKRKKKGIIYVSNIPKHMNVTRIKEILGQYGKIGRVYLQPEKLPESDKGRKKRKSFLHFTEGWIEFESKRVAKQVVELLNNKQIATRKRSQFYDTLWSMKYLPRFKWVHLSERLSYEQAVHKQRLRTEVSQARKEATFFQNNLDKSEKFKRMNRKNSS